MSVLIATARPQWLANCLAQFRSQSLGGMSVQLVVVAEGDARHFEPILWGSVACVVNKGVQGRCGAYAKDAGISSCTGDYICFWDDDNVYYPHALATLYATALDHDIGICQAEHMATWFRKMPADRIVKFGDVDTMCLCIRREMASIVLWSDHKGKGTDHAYLTKLVGMGASVRWVDVSIGKKLIGDMGEHCR